MHKDLYRLEQRLQAMVEHIDHAWRPDESDTGEYPGHLVVDHSLPGRIYYHAMQFVKRIFPWQKENH